MILALANNFFMKYTFSSLVSSDRRVISAHSLVLAAVSPQLASLLSADAADPEGDKSSVIDH